MAWRMERYGSSCEDGNPFTRVTNAVPTGELHAFGGLVDFTPTQEAYGLSLLRDTMGIADLRRKVDAAFSRETLR